MLIQFSVENFLSFNKRTTLNMIAANAYKNPDTMINVNQLDIDHSGLNHFSSRFKLSTVPLGG